MARNLFQFILEKFFSGSKKAEESALIARMIDQANAIARGEELTASHLPKPTIPERRSKPR